MGLLLSVAMPGDIGEHVESFHTGSTCCQLIRREHAAVQYYLHIWRPPPDAGIFFHDCWVGTTKSPTDISASSTEYIRSQQQNEEGAATGWNLNI